MNKKKIMREKESCELNTEVLHDLPEVKMELDDKMNVGGGG